MKNLIITLSLISLLFLASSCPKNNGSNPSNSNPQLPAATQTGANTYGCLLNGEVWIPGGEPGPFQVYGFIAQYYLGNFTLSAAKKNDTTPLTGIYWDHTNVYHTGTYYFNGNQATSATFSIYGEYGSTTTNADSLKNNVTITRFDTVNSVISGTFNLFFTQQGKDTMRITDGRFDVKYTN